MGTGAAHRVAGVGAVTGTISAPRIRCCSGRFDIARASTEFGRAAACGATARVTNASRNKHSTAGITASRSAGRTLSGTPCGKHNAAHACRTTDGRNVRNRTATNRAGPTNRPCDGGQATTTNRRAATMIRAHARRTSRTGGGGIVRIGAATCQAREIRWAAATNRRAATNRAAAANQACGDRRATINRRAVTSRARDGNRARDGRRASTTNRRAVTSRARIGRRAGAGRRVENHGAAGVGHRTSHRPVVTGAGRRRLERAEPKIPEIHARELDGERAGQLLGPRRRRGRSDVLRCSPLGH
jgi:hypothetical protein